MNKRVEIISSISGVIFLISGIAKSLDISVFSDTIASYGFENLRILSPLIILTEVFLGLLLIFHIRLKNTAFASTFVVILFTSIYSYGLIFKGIEDCGCFGKITALNTYPVFTFIRNALLTGMLVYVWRESENKPIVNEWIIGTILLLMCLTAFMSGYTYRNIGRNEKFKAIAIENSVLKEFITTSNDFTYLVFAFTYSCPHCLNSIENLKQYESSGVVDKVIGLASDDSVAEKRFREIFNPDFLIKNYPAETLFHLTNSFPQAYYIKNNSIVMKLSGELPCSYIFAKKKMGLYKK
ncbi:hypothetical protein AGMMS50262_06430 [Bacteroidia bacterium]|nr:hypothetical protein AGMMS50262_06430 [Bacteroidia bacterium]